MVSLIAKSGLEGVLPLTAEALTLAEVSVGRITSVMPFAGQHDRVAQLLRKGGLDWPAPNHAIAARAGSIYWTGRDQAFLIEADPAGLAPFAALTDQSDGWATLALSGPGWRDVLARLVPLDLGDTSFPVDQVARTGLNHMMCILHRSAPDSMRIMVFRSMARTAVHELHGAMAAVVARSHL